MASKAKKPTPKKTTKVASESTVTRIKAVNTKPSKKSVKADVVTTDKKKAGKKQKSGNGLVNTLRRIGGYFKGAWAELRQVRWPNRKATWSLTGAVLLFTGFFVAFVVLLDVFFKFIFELILK